MEPKATAGVPKPQDGGVALRAVMAAVVMNGTTPNDDDPTIDYKYNEPINPTRNFWLIKSDQRRKHEEQLRRNPPPAPSEPELTPNADSDGPKGEAPEPTQNAGSKDAFNDMPSFVGWLLAMVLVVFVGVMCVTQGFPDQGGGDPYKGMPDRPADSYPQDSYPGAK